MKCQVATDNKARCGVAYKETTCGDESTVEAAIDRLHPIEAEIVITDKAGCCIRWQGRLREQLLFGCLFTVNFTDG